MKCDWGRVDHVPGARTRGFWVIKRVNPGYPRQPAWLCKSFVDIFVVQIVYTFTTEVSVNAVVPRRIHRTGTNAFDQFANFLFEELHFLFALSFCLFPSFATSVGTPVSFGACGRSSHYVRRRVDRRRSLHELAEVIPWYLLRSRRRLQQLRKINRRRLLWLVGYCWLVMRHILRLAQVLRARRH